MKNFKQYLLEKETPKVVDLTGTLKKTSDGFYYLKIDDQLVFGVMKLLDDPKASRPPYFKKNAGNVGAHVSVILSDETPNSVVREVGNDFRFTWGEIKSVKPDGWEEMQKVYFIEVKSKHLEDLRQKYGLTRKINSNEFHITIAVIVN